MSEEFLTVVETAKKLGVSPRTVQRYCKQGRINYKWINGKRHKEIRIIPPIPVAQLPGARRRTLSGTFDYVSQNAFEETLTELEDKLVEKDYRIALLEEETVKLKSLVENILESLDVFSGNDSSLAQLKSKLNAMLVDSDKVRRTEKKLILKIAKEVRTHEKILKSLNEKL